MVSLSLAALKENNIASRWYSKTCFFQSDEYIENIDTSTISPQNQASAIIFYRWYIYQGSSEISLITATSNLTIVCKPYEVVSAVSA